MKDLLVASVIMAFAHFPQCIFVMGVDHILALLSVALLNLESLLCATHKLC